MPLNRTSARVGGRCPFPVGLAQHNWCGPGVRGFLWGLHSTAGAAMACGGSCEGCTAQLVRPWRAGVTVGPAQHSWCGPGVQGLCNGSSDSTQLYTDVIRISMILRCTLVQ